MLPFVSLADASDMTARCDDVDVPADAVVYRDQGVTSVSEEMAALVSHLLSFEGPDCRRTCEADLDFHSEDTGVLETECWAAACITDNGVTFVAQYETEAQGRLGDEMGAVEVRLDLPDGTGTWTSANFYWDWEQNGGPYGGYRQDSWRGSWWGTLRPEWPVDGWVTANAATWTTDYDAGGEAADWEDPDCTWSVEREHGDTGVVTVEVDQNDVLVYPSPTEGSRMCARMDGDELGEVDSTTWELHPGGAGCGCDDNDSACPVSSDAETGGCGGASAAAPLLIASAWIQEARRRRRGQAAGGNASKGSAAPP